jgi:FAD:protein FMN transferase
MRSGFSGGRADPSTRPRATTERASAPAASDTRRRSETTPASGVRRHACQIFTCDVGLACHGEPLVPFGEVERRLRLLEERFSRFRADSEISRLNQAAGAWCDISEEMYVLLKHALDAAVASAGLVNIAILPRLLEAGYVDSRSLRGPAAGTPGEGATDSLPVPPLTEVLELHRHRARLMPGHAVDLGGLAKGKWADDVVSCLGPNAAASLGGDVSCRGPGPSGDGWPIALPGGEVLLLSDGAVATSGTAKRRWGKDAHHLIDPRTGRPSRSDVAQATVIAATGTCAEWASSALVIGGTAQIRRLDARPDVLGWRLGAREET